MPVVSFDQASLPSLSPLTAYRWFIEYGGRYSTKWKNWGTLVTPTTPAPLHPVLCASHLQAALLLVIAEEDEMEGANSSISLMAWNVTSQPKEIVEMDGGHFGLLHHPSSLFDQAMNIQSDFLIRHLT